MRQKSGPEKPPAEDAIGTFGAATRRHFSAEGKIRIVLEGLRGERLSLLSSGEPWLLLADDSVEDGEELSGDGDDCDQLWFSGVEEALMEALERGIVAGGDQSAHEEGGAHLRPAAAESFAFPLA